ncbi:hypothetical protein SERLA73DRAFT_179515 [Serpula lacrymans var. lacrymans S7.3]|uniref:Cation efflux protein transmembrane domain-containing protein n=2 Tax=Serpula lacrymans var. lacrymans TaxID=341189 RepID=F8PSR6_SERL3|nr:hypothetical protein SERLA73DRAFT_179515 [Serpula lacrymans var. lacrymans S7.3]
MASAPAHGRRHSRLHSRNLSIFFPRPGSLPHSTIAEDGVEADRPPDVEAPITLMPSAQSEPLINGSQKRLGDGFTFGARPPNSVSLDSVHSAVGGTRRGHHHKHSLSHNFFSFLEPGSQPSAADLHTSPTPVPTSPWSPVSTISRSASSSTTSLVPSALDGPRLRTTSDSSEVEHRDVPPSVSTSAAVIAVAQFFLGAWVWVSGQQIGSLACTGLGYWIVFDAFGISLAEVVPGYLAGNDLQSKVRRPYGNGRVETVFMFAQSVYLMFASVYVCKETVEHLLLSAGEGHHHHHGDELADNLGIEFPVLLVFITLISLLGTSLSFNHHSKLVNIAGNHLSSPLSIIRSTLKPYPSSSTFIHPLPTSRAGMLLSNPFAVAPIVFCISILLFAAFLPLSQYRPFDLGLASVEALLTFNVAYKACVVLGTVLLQTSPDRSLSGVRMDAFTRALREVERHHQVLHLPTPHVWQLTPTQQHAPAKSLVVTLELHVRNDLSDSDVLELTRWAWERVVSALRLGSRSVGDLREEAEVTVGVVRE